jgi:hypothetical protein
MPESVNENLDLVTSCLSMNDDIKINMNLNVKYIVILSFLALILIDGQRYGSKSQKKMDRQKEMCIYRGN